MDFKLWEPEAQPDILGKEGSFGNIEWDYPTFINELYEPLRKKYPDYITRRSIGFDTSGEYEMWAYEFAPKNYIKTVYLQSGVHVIETDPYFGLAKLLTMIADREDERLSFIRDNVRLLVVPVVSVWGISKRGSYKEIMDADRWRFPHNSAKVNANRDCQEKKAKETVNVLKYIEENQNDICFAFDCHSTTNVVLGSYLLCLSNGTPDDILNAHVAINEALYEKHPTIIKKANMGDQNHYPGQTKPGIYNRAYVGGITWQFGIFCITTEHNDYIYDSKLGTSLTMTLSVELIGNHLLLVCEDDRYNSSLRIDRNYYLQYMTE